MILFLFFFFLIFPANAQAAEIPLDPTYCGGNNNDYYVAPGEQACSRAPNACGNGYDELNTQDKMPNPQQCMGDGEVGRAQKGCAGYVPLCCYEMARTGDYSKCIGYWERLWCTRSQCAEASSRGASDNQCPEPCNCGHANGEYCGNISPVPIETRLGIQTTATLAPTNPNPTATTTPLPPTATPDLPTPTSFPSPESFPNCNREANGGIWIVFQPDHIYNPAIFNNAGGLKFIAINTGLKCKITGDGVKIVYNSRNIGFDFWTENALSLPNGNYVIYLWGPRNLRQRFAEINIKAGSPLDCRTNPNADCGDFGNTQKRAEKMLFSGDANGDNIINLLDFELFRQNNGKFGTAGNTDFDYNGKVEYLNGINDDFLPLRNNFGKRGV